MPAAFCVGDPETMRRRRAEAWIALAGPVASLALVAFFIVTTLALDVVLGLCLIGMFGLAWLFEYTDAAHGD